MIGYKSSIDKRAKLYKRRQREDMPRVPFKDSMGATIKGDRRKIPDRRRGEIQAEWIDTEWSDTYQ